MVLLDVALEGQGQINDIATAYIFYSFYGSQKNTNGSRKFPLRLYIRSSEKFLSFQKVITDEQQFLFYIILWWTVRRVVG